MKSSSIDAMLLPAETPRSFVRKVVGFGVGVGIGCAPLLGKLHVPGFEAMLTLFPAGLQATLIPFSGFVMGCVSVVVQFYSDQGQSKIFWRRWFTRVVLIEVIA